jgi:hypothetical protein
MTEQIEAAGAPNVLDVLEALEAIRIDVSRVMSRMDQDGADSAASLAHRTWHLLDAAYDSLVEAGESAEIHARRRA